MKKILTYLFFAAIVITGCQKKSDDLIQGQSVDQRLNEALSQYQKILTSAPYGWKVLEKTNIAYNGGASDSVKNTFIYFMKFTDSNTVTMYGDFDTIQAVKPNSSGYRIKALQRPTIIFDTYSYIHIPCDPDPSISKSPLDPGQGWGTDFQFEFADNVQSESLGDTIHLKGLTNGAPAYMVRATQAEQALFTSGQFGNNLKAFQSVSKIFTYWKRFTFGTSVFEIGQIDLINKVITFNWLDASGNLQTFTTSFHFGFDGSVILDQPLVNGSTVVKGFSGINFNGTGIDLTVVGPNVVGALNPSAVPLKVDLTAPVRWQAAAIAGSYCYSWNGFHVNGVDDAYGIKSLTNGAATFYYYVYWPNYYTNPADRFSPIMLSGNSLAFNSYGTAPKPPTFTIDGRAIFTLLANNGVIPPGGAVAKSNTLLYNASGFYFVQIDAKTYDMVSASDAKSWIRWIAF